MYVTAICYLGHSALTNIGAIDPPRQSRTVVPASEMYSAASAVLLNELLKGGISLAIAYYNAVNSPSSGGSGAFMDNRLSEKRLHEDSRGRDSSRLTRAAVKVKDDVFR